MRPVYPWDVPVVARRSTPDAGGSATPSKWTSVWVAVAGAILVTGGVAWLSKLAVIVATEGRVAYTGAAAAFFTLGLVSMLLGSTGVGLRLMKHEDTGLRISVAMLSPAAFLIGFGLLQGVVVGLYDLARWIVGNLGPEYVREEVAILLTAIISLGTGMAMLSGVVRARAARTAGHGRRKSGAGRPDGSAQPARKG